RRRTLWELCNRFKEEVTTYEDSPRVDHRVLDPVAGRHGWRNAAAAPRRAGRPVGVPGDVAPGVSRPRWRAVRALARLFSVSGSNDVAVVCETRWRSRTVQRHWRYLRRIPPPGDRWAAE